MIYEKAKRKNEDAPSIFASLLQGLWFYGIVLPLQGAWWLMRQSVRGAWHVTKQSAKGAWWLTQNGLRLGWEATKWVVQLPVRVFTWVWFLIMGLPPEFETQRETNIYRLIRRRTRRRNFFALHTLLYSLGLFVSAVAIVSIFRNSSRLGFDPFQGISSTATFAITWTIVWAFHLAHKRSGDREDRELHEALGYEYSRAPRKAKQPVYEEAYYASRLAENDNYSANPSENYDEGEDGYARAYND